MLVEIEHKGKVVADLGQTPTRRGAIYLIMTWARKHTPYSCNKGYVRGACYEDYDWVDYGDYEYFGRIWRDEV